MEKPNDMPSLRDEYVNLGNDLRFHVDQRIKVVGAYVLISGLLANVVKDHQSVLLAFLACAFSYFALSWELRTAGWLQVLMKRAREIEAVAQTANIPISTYLRHDGPFNKGLFVSASNAVLGVYILGSVAWLIFGFYSWPNLWR